MGLMLIIYGLFDSIILILLSFYLTFFFFNFFNFFFLSPIPPGVGQICREEFSLVATLFCAPP